jgi:hypothetical protein
VAKEGNGYFSGQRVEWALRRRRVQFLIAFALVLFFCFLAFRKKSIKEGTWAGTSGMKSAYIWNHASSEQRSLMLAGVGILDGKYRDDLLSKGWDDVPTLVQVSLVRTLEEIRNEQR